MAQTNPQVPIDHDPLGETLHQLRLHGTLYCRADLTAPWGIDLPAMEGCMMFHIVTAGQCLLEVDGAEPRLLREGSLALVPHGLGHVLRSTTGDVKTPLFDIPVDKISERYEVMRHGGGGEPMQLTCGVLRFDHVAAHRLLALLPRVVEADSWSAADGGWLRSTIGLITHEAQSPRPGGETIITRLADVIVVQAIRSWLNSAPEAEQGWLAALRDPQIGRALAAIHRRPGRDWNLESLGREAHMSRSAFSARFTELVGESAIQYLTGWRLQTSRGLLQESSDPLAIIAEQVGYHSEPAFCRAFKRAYGVSPGSLRRAPAS